MAKVIGIDLGMTNSCVAVVEDIYLQRVKVTANADDVITMPSVVASDKRGNPCVGQIAKCRAVIDSKNTIHSVKRFIGRRYNEVTQEVMKVRYIGLRSPHLGES